MDSHTDNVKPSVLIVDDEKAIATGIAQKLATAEYEATAVTSSAEALIYLAQNSADVLLIDIEMPQMRGDELYRFAKERYPDLAVIMMATEREMPSALGCLRDGAYDYLLKPYDLPHVLVRVEKAVENRRLLVETREQEAYLAQRIAEQSNRIRLIFQQSLQSLNHALEAKDENTRNHSNRVAELATALAMILRPEDADFHIRLRVAAQFHDIGKIGVPEAILNKAGQLSISEFNEIKRHPVIGETILGPLFDDPLILSIVRHHHEQWDGKGYPDGIPGPAIPFGARIVSVAASYNAMISPRPHRPGMSSKNAMELLSEGSGIQWDPTVVAALQKIDNSGYLQALMNRANQKENYTGYPQIADYEPFSESIAA